MMDAFELHVLESQQGKLRGFARQWKRSGLSFEDAMQEARLYASSHYDTLPQDAIDQIVAAVYGEELHPSPEQAVIEKRSPSKIYFPVQEISAVLEWSTLSASEFRIALHFMTLAWASDGTLPDDNWMIARRLSISQKQWQAFRETMTKTGWLITQDGRLTNGIVKREYDRAQTALMKAIMDGRRGGLRKAEKAILNENKDLPRDPTGTLEGG